MNYNFNFIKLIIFTQFLCHTNFSAILNLILCEKGTGVDVLNILVYKKSKMAANFGFFPALSLITSVILNLEW